MHLNIRRVVTGHDAEGRAVVTHDGFVENAVNRRPGQAGSVLWSTEKVPADNNGTDDAAFRPLGTINEAGTVFRIVEYGPGVAPRVHRTSSVDYAVVISGSIDMELDDGVVVHLEAGDTLVQRGTVHNWVNRGSEPCRIAFVLVAAEPVLNAVG